MVEAGLRSRVWELARRCENRDGEFRFDGLAPKLVLDSISFAAAAESG